MKNCNEPLGSINDSEFIKQLSHYTILKTEGVSICVPSTKGSFAALCKKNIHKMACCRRVMQQGGGGKYIKHETEARDTS